MAINYTPQLARSPIFYKAAQALGEKFVYNIFIYTGHHTTNKPASATYTITKDKLADVVEVGSATATTSSKLVDSVKLFTETVEVGDLVFNTTDNTIAIVSAIDSDTTLSIDTNIMESGEGYKIFSKTSATIEIAELIRDYFKTEYYNLAVDAVWCDITTEVQIASGTTTATTSNKLVDSTATFIRQLLPSSFTVTAKNTTDNTSATVSAVDSDTTLSVSSDIFASGEKYTLTVPATASNNTPWINLDGYGFFKDGINPGNSILVDKQVLMTNSTIYYKKGKDIIIPVYAPNQSTLTFSIGGVSNVFWNSVDEFWNTYENTWGNIITPIKITDGAVKDSGTATGTTTNKLVDSNQNFLTTVKVGMTVYNSTDKTVSNVTAVDSNTQLTLADNIMATGEAYQIQDGKSSDKIQYVVISQTNGFSGGTVTVTDGLGKSLSRVIKLEEIACTKYTPFIIGLVHCKTSYLVKNLLDNYKQSLINSKEAQ